MSLSLNLVVIATKITTVLTLPSRPTNIPSIHFALGQCYIILINVVFVNKSYIHIGGLVGGSMSRMRR